MKKLILTIALICMAFGIAFSQTNSLKKLPIQVGEWTGVKSNSEGQSEKMPVTIKYLKDGSFMIAKKKTLRKNYINEKTIIEDFGMISFNTDENKYLFKQLSGEGDLHQFALVEALSNESVLVFELDEDESSETVKKQLWTFINTEKLNSNPKYYAKYLEEPISISTYVYSTGYMKTSKKSNKK